MIVHVENMQELTKNILELINDCSTVSEHKVNI